MYSLVTGFVEYVTTKPEFFVLMVGLDAAGKSTMLEKMKPMFQKTPGLPLERIVPTVGLNLGKFDFGRCRLVVWDLGGQTGLRTIWQRYFKDAQAIVFVVDAAAPERFAEAREALAELLTHRSLAGLPLLVLANKQDLPGCSSVESVHVVVPPLDPPRPVRVAPVSAIQGVGLAESFQWLAETLMRQQPKPRVPG